MFFLKKPKEPKPFRLGHTSSLELALIFSVIPLSGYAAIHSIFVSPSLPVALSMGGMAAGSSVRFITRLDNWSVSRHFEGRSNKLSRFIVNQFWKSPLRFYTLNQLEKRLDDRYLGESAKRLRQQLKIEKKEEIDLALKDSKVVRYLMAATDPRKHTRAILYLGLSIFSAMRLLNLQDLDHKKPLTPLQIAERFGGYGFGLIVAVANIDAWVQRKAAEPGANNFFTLSDRIMARLPTRHLGRMLVKWDYRKVQKVITERQSWSWRQRKALYARLPNKGLREWFLTGLEAKKMIVTPEVQEALDTRGISSRIAVMEKIVSDQNNLDTLKQPLPTITQWREAVRDMLSKNQEMAERDIAIFKAYADEFVANEKKGLESSDKTNENKAAIRPTITISNQNLSHNDKA